MSNNLVSKRSSYYREAALRRIFSRYDRDGNGRIDRQELGAILKEMGKVFSDAEVKTKLDLLSIHVH